MRVIPRNRNLGVEILIKLLKIRVRKTDFSSILARTQLKRIDNNGKKIQEQDLREEENKGRYYFLSLANLWRL